MSDAGGLPSLWLILVNGELVIHIFGVDELSGPFSEKMFTGALVRLLAEDAKPPTHEVADPPETNINRVDGDHASRFLHRVPSRVTALGHESWIGQPAA